MAKLIKNQKHILYVGILLFLGFIGISIFTFYKSNQSIEKGYLRSEGTAAKDFAVLTAANIHLDDAQVAKLKTYNYAELQSSEENIMLRDMMDNDDFSSPVDYAYVMIHLPENQIRYRVDEENQQMFDAPLGTPLDIMWLLDVNVSENAEDHAQTTMETVSDELQRYSYYIEEDALIFGEAPTYILNSSEWGDHICGYAPLYSTSGKYIGVVGVELQTANYDSYRKSAIISMGILLTISTITLILLFLILYFKYNKLQYDKIYTDSLTRICNRSYYNDQFIKKMNAARVPGERFALMIADIDWFKKVNDTFGHEIGDEVLMEMSTLLLESFGKNHVIRFGGEEFVVGIWVKDEEELRGQLQQLFTRIRQMKFSKQQIGLSISLGCSHYAAEDLNGWLMSGMLKAADCLLYEAKENGRRAYRITEYNIHTTYKKK